MTARLAVDILNIQFNATILFYQKIRKIIEWHLAQESTHMFDNCIELDENYFGDVRKGKVYTVVVPDTKANTFIPIISGKTNPDSLVYTDS